MKNPFKMPDAATVAKKQQEAAKLSLLEAERDFEIATARLQMARATLSRLSNHQFLSTTVKEAK